MEGVNYIIPAYPLSHFDQMESQQVLRETLGKAFVL